MRTMSCFFDSQCSVRSLSVIFNNSLSASQPVGDLTDSELIFRRIEQPDTLERDPTRTLPTIIIPKFLYSESTQPNNVLTNNEHKRYFTTARTV